MTPPAETPPAESDPAELDRWKQALRRVDGVRIHDPHIAIGETVTLSDGRRGRIVSMYHSTGMLEVDMLPGADVIDANGHVHHRVEGVTIHRSKVRT